MKVVFDGFDSKYDLEQMCCLFFPGEKPVFTDDGQGVIHVCKKDGNVTVTVEKNNRIGKETATFDLSLSGDERKRAESTAFKKAFYLAAVNVTKQSVPWGILSGIRPSKPIERLLKTMSPTEAADYVVKNYFTEPERAALGVKTAAASLEADKVLDKNGVEIYVGIPFCPSRCRYCSFVSHSIKNAGNLLPDYLDKLCEEITVKGEMLRETGKTPETLYIGGGTPAVLSPGDISRLFEVADKAFSLDKLKEMTFEAGRPDCITCEKAKALALVSKDIRVCVNPQSLNDKALRLAGRPHTADDYLKAVEAVKSAGIGRINSDVIAGLDGDDVLSFSKTLVTLISLDLADITVHTLCKKRAADGKPSADNPDTAAMVELSLKLLPEAGYSPYYLYRQRNTAANLENVGWTKYKPCLYNIAMMEELRTVIACGAGSVSKIIEGGNMRRVANMKYPYEYLSRPFRNKEELFFGL